MTDSTRTDSWELGDYLRVLRRRWWAVIALALAGLVIAAAAVKVMRKSYTATASVSVNALPTDAHALPGGTVDMDNEAQLAGSKAVSTAAARHLQGVPGASGLTQSATITVPPNTTLLDIACEASKPVRAAACANAVASAYLSVRLSNSANILKGEITSLRAKAVSILPQVTKLNVQQQQIKGPLTTRSLTGQLQAKEATAQFNALLGKMNYLNSELAAVQSPSSTAAGRIVQTASVPRSPSSPKKLLILPSGLIAGLILGLIVALWLELRDDRLFGARDLERDHGLETLLDLRTKQRKRGWRRTAPGPLPSAAFAELAEYVAHASRNGCFVVLVVGSSPEAGTSLVAANLGAVLSRARPGVFLVSAAPGATLAPQLLGVNKRAGLSELLAGNVTIDEVVQSPSGAPELGVIAPGRKSASGDTPHNYDARRHLMSELRAEAQYVIVESPLTAGMSPALTLAELADAAIVVVETARTRHNELDSWLGQLERVRVPVLGTVLISRRPRRPRAARRRLWSRRARGHQSAKSLGLTVRSAEMAEQHGAR